MNVAQKYWNLTGQEKRMFYEALFFLYLTKLILIFISFKTVAGIISKKGNLTQPVNDIKTVEIKDAIARANRLAFWKNKCLVQSLTARWMLQRRGISSCLTLGVALNENKKLVAHAWIQVNNIEIINKNLNYKELIVIH